MLRLYIIFKCEMFEVDELNLCVPTHCTLIFVFLPHEKPYNSAILTEDTVSLTYLVYFLLF